MTPPLSMLDRFINNLMDIPKVEGLVLYDRQGALLYQKMPTFFLDEALEQLGRRVVSMYETVDENFIQCDDYILKYPGKYLMLRRGQHYYMFVLCGDDINLLSLKMVTNMTLKHITPDMLPAPQPSSSGGVNGAVNGVGHAVTAPPFAVNGASHGVNGAAPAVNGSGRGTHPPMPVAAPVAMAPVAHPPASASRAPFAVAPKPPPMAAVPVAPVVDDAALYSDVTEVTGIKPKIARPERPNRTYRGSTY